MNKLFTQNPGANPQSNTFDLSHDIKLTFKMGRLIPTLVTEVLPGDKFSIRCENLLRFSPLVSPVMHNIQVTTHYFHVPLRIIWPGFEDFITGETEVLPPLNTHTSNATFKGSLLDYLGLPKSIPTTQGNREEISVLPIAAYNKIYNEYYRDQNLIDPLIDTCENGNNNSDLYATALSPQRRAWNHDYFTSCLPFAQKGEEVTLPLLNEDQAIVQYQAGTGTPAAQFVNSSDGTSIPTAGPLQTIEANGTGISAVTSGGIATSVEYDPNDSLYVDINTEAATINTLRRAFKLQEWLEKNARGGTRYNEHMRSHFGQWSSDKRLQRPEYIGGYKQSMVISEVLSTAETINTSDETINPVGQYAGHGITAGGSDTKHYTAEEHGFIIGIINVQPTTSYNQGLHRMWTRKDKFDYYWPSFANIGEQEVLVKELRLDQSEDVGNQVFGYIPRYADYKYINSRVAGDMRDTLQSFHLAREFDTTPALNKEFIECAPRKNIFSVTDPTEDEIFGHIIHHVKARRKMPIFGTPTI